MVSRPGVSFYFDRIARHGSLGSRWRFSASAMQKQAAVIVERGGCVLFASLIVSIHEVAILLSATLRIFDPDSGSGWAHIQNGQLNREEDNTDYRVNLLYNPPW